MIGTLDKRLQSTQYELQQAVDVEIRLRDTMSAEMREANARSSKGTMPQTPPQQPPIPTDFVAQIQDMMIRERRETTTLLDSRLDAFSDLAETRDRSIRELENLDALSDLGWSRMNYNLNKNNPVLVLLLKHSDLQLSQSIPTNSPQHS